MPPESVHAQRHFLGFEMMPYATILRMDLNGASSSTCLLGNQDNVFDNVAQLPVYQSRHRSGILLMWFPDVES